MPYADKLTKLLTLNRAEAGFCSVDSVLSYDNDL
jgi:hypothetical protein